MPNEQDSRAEWSDAWPLDSRSLPALNRAIGFFRERATYPNAKREGVTWDQLDEFLRLVLIDGLDPEAAICRV